MSIGAEVLKDLPAEDLATISPKIRNGDLLFCSADDPFSRLIGWSTRSPWTPRHRLALEGLERIVATWCVQKIRRHSVAIGHISQTSSGRGLSRQDRRATRHDSRGAGRLRPLIHYAIDCMGDPFSPAEIAKIGMRIAFARTGQVMPEQPTKDEFHLFRAIDHCYRKVGVEIQDGKGSSPPDVANDEGDRRGAVRGR